MEWLAEVEEKQYCRTCSSFSLISNNVINHVRVCKVNIIELNSKTFNLFLSNFTAFK